MESISKRVNNLTMQAEVFSVDPPITDKTPINIDISSYCNQKCIYCLHHHLGEHENGRFIDEALFYRIAKEAFDLGVREIGLYSSGEPLTNPRIYEYISFLKKLGYTYVFISTNGLLCTPENLEKLVTSGIDSIKFSISAASKESFFAHHGVEGFDRVYENLKNTWTYRNAHKLKYRIFIYSAITRQNVAELPRMKELYEPYCDEYMQNKMTNPLNMLDGCKMLYNETDITGELNYYKPTAPCPLLFRKIYVSAEGNLCICPDTLTSVNAIATSIADLNEMSLKDAYHSKAFKTLRDKHLSGNIENTICNRCINGVRETMFSIRSCGLDEPFTMDDIDISTDIDFAFPGKAHRN